MKLNIEKKHIASLFSFATLMAMVGPAFAGVPAPAPLAGVLGPWGLGIAGAAYCGYRIIKYFRDR